MAQFCEKCGTRLNPGAVFCPECGAKIAPPAQPQQYADPPEKAPGAYPGKSKKSPVWTVLLIVFSVLLIGELAVASFVAPGFLLRAPKEDVATESPPASVVPQSESNAQAMLRYARELEENGQYEAAAQIYSMLPDEVVKETQRQAAEVLDNIPEKQIMDALGQARDFFNDAEKLTEGD